MTDFQAIPIKQDSLFAFDKEKICVACSRFHTWVLEELCKQ